VERQLKDSEAKQLEFIRSHPSIMTSKLENEIASAVSEKELNAELELSKLQRRLARFDKHNGDEVGKAIAKAWALKLGFPATTEKTDVLYRDNLTEEINEKRQELDELKTIRDDHMKKLLEFSTLDAEERSITAAVSRNRQMFDETLKQLRSFHVQQREAGFDSHILSRPTVRSIDEKK
jgi:hypothetical protein